MADRKVALVTGGSRGAGAGVARGLGELGYTVYVTGRSVEHPHLMQRHVVDARHREGDDVRRRHHVPVLPALVAPPMTAARDPRGVVHRYARPAQRIVVQGPVGGGE